MKKTSKIYVAGHRGLVGSALMRKLLEKGYTNLIIRTSKQLDLRRQDKVERFFIKERPEYVFLAAAKVGGILANSTYKAEFIYDNLMIATNVIHASYKYGVKKLLNLGSSCIYPKNAPQPLNETCLLSGYLEPTNEPYAIAKITAIKICRYYNEQYGTNFLSVMPTNLYGPNDNYDLHNSHVLPAMVRKFYNARVKKARSVVLWGTGKPYREFLHSDDCADACVFLMERYSFNDLGEVVNIGTGKDLTIKQLANIIRSLVDFKGRVVWDRTKPDGTYRKLLNTARITALGWRPKIELVEGIQKLLSCCEKEKRC